MTVYLGKKPVGVTKIIYREKPTDEWQPNPKWWDIKKILDEDTRDYPGKVGVILYNFNDVSDFTLSSSGMTAVATSDGAFYTYADNGANVSHNWDTSKDKDDGRGAKTRWVIYYYTTGTTTDAFRQDETKFGWAYNYIAYLVLRINCTSVGFFCNAQRLLEAIDNVGYNIIGINFTSFCKDCTSLTKLPDGLDTSNGTSFNNFCYGCVSLKSLPDGLDTSSGTNFGSFCEGCALLTRLPDGLDTSNGTSFNNFCYGCVSLKSLPDGLDTSSGTNFGSFCYNCYSLTRLPDGLDTSNGTSFQYFCYKCTTLTKLPDGVNTGKGTNLSYFCSYCESMESALGMNWSSATTGMASYSYPFLYNTWLKQLKVILPSKANAYIPSGATRISIESFRYIADHAPDVTATPRTLTIGSTNITRCNEADPTIITDLNAKGWSVN